MANFKLDNAARYAKSHEWVRIEDGIAAWVFLMPRKTCSAMWSMWNCLRSVAP